MKVESLEKIVSLGGNVAQIILAAATIGAFFFTVIPLYQKAAVDEQVAKQQVKLGKLEQQIRVSYERVRADVVRQYFFATGSKCTALLDPPELTQGAKPLVDFNDHVLSLDVPACMRAELGLSNIANDLTPVDFVAFSTAVDRTSRAISIAQLAARARIAAMDPARAINGPLNLPSYAELSLRLYKKAGATDQQLRETIQLISANTRKSEVVSEYASYFREQLQKLATIPWPSYSRSD